MTRSAVIPAALLCVWYGAAFGQSSSSPAPTASLSAQGQAGPTTSTPASQSTSKRQSPAYEVVEIPYLSPTAADLTVASCSVAAVNKHGIAVGSCQQDCNGCGGVPSIPSVRAWMYQQKSGALDELTFEPGEHEAAATDVSKSGIITGYMLSPTPTLGPQPVFWTASGGAVLLTGEFDDSVVATAVNVHGTIVGTYTAPSEPDSAALLWSPPNYAQTVLPQLACDVCGGIFMASANAINNRGTVVGQSLSNDGLLAVEWQSGTVTSLGSLQDSGTSDAYGINNEGDIVGDSQTKQATTPAHPGPFTHAFLYHQGGMTDLGTLPGDTDSSAKSINKKGQIVGTSTSSVNSGRAFLYQDGQMYDLNTLIAPASSLAGSIKLAAAVSISSNGWIAANGIDTRDQSAHGFLLIPSH